MCIRDSLGLSRLLAALPRAFQHGYLLFVVVLGWVPFRSESFSQTMDFYGAMLLWKSGALSHFHPLERYVDAYVVGLTLFAAALSVPLLSGAARMALSGLSSAQKSVAITTGFWILFVVTIVSVGAASYSPFIYFRF